MLGRPHAETVNVLQKHFDEVFKEKEKTKDESLRFFVVCDEDIRTKEKRDQEQKDYDKKANVELFVWKRREYENFFVCPPALAELISNVEDRSMKDLRGKFLALAGITTNDTKNRN